MLAHGVLMHAEFRAERGDRRRRPRLLQAFQDGGPLTGQPRSRRGAPHRRRAEGTIDFIFHSGYCSKY